MEELIALTPKLLELGALGVITLFLLVRGTASIIKFADAVNGLTAAVAQLSTKISNMDNRVNYFEHDLKNKLDVINSHFEGLSPELKGIERRLDKLENYLNELRRAKY